MLPQVGFDSAVEPFSIRKPVDIDRLPPHPIPGVPKTALDSMDIGLESC